MRDDEPLARWAARREQRLRAAGHRTALVLTASQSASHVNQDAPRLILEWDGFTWHPVGVARDYKAACLLLHPPKQGGA